VAPVELGSLIPLSISVIPESAQRLSGTAKGSGGGRYSLSCSNDVADIALAAVPDIGCADSGMTEEGRP